MSCLRCVYLLAYKGVQHILCCVFVLFVFVLCLMLPVSLDCPFLIAPSVISNIYLTVSASKSFRGDNIHTSSHSKLKQYRTQQFPQKNYNLYLNHEYMLNIPKLKQLE